MTDRPEGHIPRQKPGPTATARAAGSPTTEELATAAGARGTQWCREPDRRRERSVPKIVDRTERREEVLSAVWRVIARSGIDGVSVRDIAAEAGFSTGVIAHYFRDKDDVLVSALQRVVAQESERIAAGTSGLVGLAALRRSLEQVLPLDEQRSLEMTVWISFWSRAVGDPRLAAEQRRFYGAWRTLLRRYFREALQAGEVWPGLDPYFAADSLTALVDGLCIGVVVEPGRFRPGDLEQLVEAHIIGLATGALRAPSDLRVPTGEPAAVAPAPLVRTGRQVRPARRRGVDRAQTG